MAQEVDLIKSVANTIDNVVEKVVGGRPVSRVLGILEAVAPANVVRRLGLPAPGDLVDRAAAEVETALKTGTLPRPPSPREIFGR